MIAYALAILIQIVFAFTPVGVSDADCDCDQDYCHVCESAFINATKGEYPGDSGDDDLEWFVYHIEAERDYRAEFTALFNSYEIKFAKNGRTMIRVGSSGPFKFAKKG